MDKAQFTSEATGEVIRITSPRQDWAFIPNKMPPDWEFPIRLWPLLSEAKERLGTLNGIGQTLPDTQLLLAPLQNREALTSSSLEGTFITPEELLLFELDPREPRSSTDRVADWREVWNYNRALNKGREMLNDLPLCHRVFQEMHRVLLGGVRGRNKAPGEYRKRQVQIGSTGRFIPPPANYVTELMDDLEAYMNKDDDKLDPLVRCFAIHYQFEAIHPFADGNGRVGRSLLALMIYKWLNHDSPWLYMSAFFEKFKDEYVDNLFKISTEAAWEDWIEFCLRGAIAQANDSIRRCDQFNTLKAEFHQQADTASPRTHSQIDELFSYPVLSVTRVAKKYNVTYPTAKSDLERLVSFGILRELDGSRPKAYFAPQIMSAAYDD